VFNNKNTAPVKIDVSADARFYSHSWNGVPVTWPVLALRQLAQS